MVCKQDKTMSSALDQTAKTKLAVLVKELDAVVTKAIDDMDTKEVTYILENFKQHLKYDVSRNFEERRVEDLKQSPFDDLLGDL